MPALLLSTLTLFTALKRCVITSCRGALGERSSQGLGWGRWCASRLLVVFLLLFFYKSIQDGPFFFPRDCGFRKTKDNKTVIYHGRRDGSFKDFSRLKVGLCEHVLFLQPGAGGGVERNQGGWGGGANSLVGGAVSLTITCSRFF